MVIACPMCMKHYGVAEADLLPGIQVGKPELDRCCLVQDGTQTTDLVIPADVRCRQPRGKDRTVALNPVRSARKS